MLYALDEETVNEDAIKIEHLDVSFSIYTDNYSI
jgi:hypothetical protein